LTSVLADLRVSVSGIIWSVLGWAVRPCHVTCPTRTGIAVLVGVLVFVGIGVRVGVIVGVFVRVGVFVPVVVLVAVEVGVAETLGNELHWARVLISDADRALL